MFSAFFSRATIHVVRVWDGYYQFFEEVNFSSDITIQLGDTVQWLPYDPPAMVHTITSTNIPVGATPFDQIWQAPADTFFQYIPQVAGLYEYECTPHATSHNMVGTINVVDPTAHVTSNIVLNQDIRVYPNPAANVIELTGVEGESDYVIFDINGKKIMVGTSGGSINIANLVDGIYYIEIVGDRRDFIKFIKQ